MEKRVKDYRTREWNRYTIVVESGEEPPFQRGECPLDVVHSESQKAKEVGEKATRFYVDLECIAADIEEWVGGDVGVLTEDWRGHKKGAVVMLVYEGIRDTPPTFTYAVEVT